jgi:hypothetical protein
MSIKRKKLIIGENIGKFNKEVSERYLRSKVGRINFEDELVEAKIYRPEIVKMIRKRGLVGITPVQLEKDLRKKGATNAQRQKLINSLKDVYDKNSPGYKKRHSIVERRKKIIRAEVEDVPVGYNIKERVFANRGKGNVKRVSAQNLSSTSNEFSLSHSNITATSILAKGNNSVVNTKLMPPSVGPLNKNNILPINNKK